MLWASDDGFDVISQYVVNILTIFSFLFYFFFLKGRTNHWSAIIGSSHSKNYILWEYGGYASEGVKQVAELGSPVKMEEEIRQQVRCNLIRALKKCILPCTVNDLSLPMSMNVILLANFQSRKRKAASFSRHFFVSVKDKIQCCELRSLCHSRHISEV